MTITSDDIYALMRRGESISVEMKKCSDKLPRSVWETYCAFANSREGVREVVDVKEVWLYLPLVRTSKSDEGTSKTESTVKSTVKSAFGDKKHIEGQVKDSLGQEIGQENRNEEQGNEQVKEQVNLTEKQKEVLVYLLDHPTASLKTCSDATGASAMSIRHTFKKVKSWLDIHHEGPDKTGIWRFELIKND